MNVHDFDFDIYGNGFEKSMIICNLYKYIINMKDDTYIEDVYTKISHLTLVETIVYDLLDLKEVDRYLDEIPKPVDEDIPELYRYYQKLLNRKMKILGGDIMLYQNDSVYSIISGIIAINSYVRMYQKLNKMVPYNESDQLFLENIMLYFNNLKYNYLSFVDYAEKYALRYNYDFDKMPLIDISKLPAEIKFYIDVINSTLLYSAKNCIDNLMVYRDAENNVENVFDNLFEMTSLEEIANLLDQMRFAELISFYFNAYKEQDNNIQSNGIRKILSKRKKELFD